jgi:hypothetical protein
MYFCVGLMLSAVAVLSYAETIPATPKPSGTVFDPGAWRYSNYSIKADPVSAAKAGKSICVDKGTFTLGGAYGSGGAVLVALAGCPYMGDSNFVTFPVCPAGSSSAGAEPGCKTNNPTYECPLDGNWTLVGELCTRADCAADEWRQSDGTCKKNCSAYGTNYSSGYYDIGTSPTGRVQNSGCTPDGCAVLFSGDSPAATRVVDGVTRYYAQGTYDYGGPEEICTPGTDAGVPAGSDTPPEDSCGAGQGKATMNGSTVCIDTKTGEPVDTKAPTTSEKETTNTTDNGDGTQTTETVKETTTCAGDSCTTTKTTTTSGSGGGGGGTSTETTTQSKNDFCAKNPNDPQCTGGGGGGGAGDGEGEGEDSPSISTGELGKVPTLYEPKYPNGIIGVWNENIGAIKSSPLFSLPQVFAPTNINGGSCPNWSMSANLGARMNFGGHSIAPPCYVWDFIKIVVIIGALMLARALIFGG